MKKTSDLEKVKWLINTKPENYGFNKVKGTLPDMFDKYLKIYFKFGVYKKPKLAKNIDSLKWFFGLKKNIFIRDPSEKLLNEISWQEIASIYNVPFDKQFTSSYLSTILPEEICKMYNAEYNSLDRVINILGLSRKSIIYWQGDDRIVKLNDNISDHFSQPISIEIKNVEFLELFSIWNKRNRGIFNIYPMFWFDEDRQWCFAEIHRESIFWILGCSNDIANKISRTNEIESVELSYNDEYF